MYVPKPERRLPSSPVSSPEWMETDSDLQLQPERPARVLHQKTQTHYIPNHPPFPPFLHDGQFHVHGVEELRDVLQFSRFQRTKRVHDIHIVLDDDRFQIVELRIVFIFRPTN